MASSGSSPDSWAGVAEVLQRANADDPQPELRKGALKERPEWKKIKEALSQYTQVRDVNFATGCTGVDAPRVGLLNARVRV